MVKKVQIYTTPTCVYCAAAKKFFGEKGVTFQEYDVATDLDKRKEMVERTGQMGVPVIMVDNDIVVGFNRSRLEQLLGV